MEAILVLTDQSRFDFGSHGICFIKLGSAAVRLVYRTWLVRGPQGVVKSQDRDETETANLQ